VVTVKNQLAAPQALQNLPPVQLLEEESNEVQ
jgi:hypothetical protein